MLFCYQKSTHGGECPDQQWRSIQEWLVEARRFQLVWFSLICFFGSCTFSSGLHFQILKFSFNLLATVCFVTILHRCCKSTTVPQTANPAQPNSLCQSCLSQSQCWVRPAPTEFRLQANKILIHHFYSVGFLMAELTEIIYSVRSGTPGVVQVGHGVSLWQSHFNLSCREAEPLNYLRLLIQQIFTLKGPILGPWCLVDDSLFNSLNQGNYIKEYSV